MLFVLRPALGSAHCTLPRVQIVVGAVVLVNAALLATGWFAAVRRNRGDGSAGRAQRMLTPVATRTRQLLNGRSLWAAGVAGLGIALPSIDYLAALALIVASGAAAAAQFGALLLFNTVAFGLVGDPAAVLPGGPGTHPRNAVGPLRLDAFEGAPRGRGSARRGRLCPSRHRVLRACSRSGYGGLFSTYCRPESSCDTGSAAPPNAACVAGAVTAAGS